MSSLEKKIGAGPLDFAHRLQVIGRRIPLVVISLCLLLSLSAVVFGQESPWVRPSKPSDPLVWGRRDGIVFGLFSPGGIRGPRGLIRVGLFTPDAAGPQLLNYIAVEPVVQRPGARLNRNPSSEMERSTVE